jgi:hypothetical protein
VNKIGNFCGKVGYTTEQAMLKKLRRRNFRKVKRRRKKKKTMKKKFAERRNFPGNNREILQDESKQRGRGVSKLQRGIKCKYGNTSRKFGEFKRNSKKLKEKIRMKIP